MSGGASQLRSMAAARLGLSLLLSLAGLSTAPAQDEAKPPSPEEYAKYHGAQVVPAGAFVVNGRRLVCGKRPTVIDRKLDDVSAAYPRFTIVNPDRFARLTPTTKFFFYYVACRFTFIGHLTDDADCYAARRGSREGWLTENGVDEVCAALRNYPKTSLHMDGPARCQLIRKCFAAATVSKSPPRRP
jgi:hypothetical protein